jgi:hypothetical protein
MRDSNQNIPTNPEEKSQIPGNTDDRQTKSGLSGKIIFQFYFKQSGEQHLLICYCNFLLSKDKSNILQLCS